METILPCICIQATRKRNPKCSLSHTFLCRCLSWKNVVLAGVYIHMWIRFSPPLGSRTKIGLRRKTILREYSKRIFRADIIRLQRVFLFVLVEMFTNHSQCLLINRYNLLLGS